MAFLGKIGKTLGLGSTGQVLGSVALAGATGNPAYVSGAFRSSQMGSAVESAQGSNVQNTIELQSSGSEGLGNNLVQARTGRGIPRVGRPLRRLRSRSAQIATYDSWGLATIIVVGLSE